MGIDKVIILPGNGDGDVQECNWYAWLAVGLRERFGRSVHVVLRNMPDPEVARRGVWLPFIKDRLGANERTLVIGHSSGAVAAMRLAEEMPLYGIILVGACHTDLGDANERASNYYPRGSENEWNWESQVANTNFISVFASASDPFLPIEEQRHVGERLCKKVDGGAAYIEYPKEAQKGHWCAQEAPELLEHAIKMVEKGLVPPGP
ncbi:hypothetical protein DIPPA_24023 [Diplonema papillatum]|nr:hypothetical protein DIPPA_24023 [Diplonema papillatum]